MIKAALLCLFATTTTFAFSQRIIAGEINYRHVSGLTFEFNIQSISFAEPVPNVEIDFGDGYAATISTNSEYLGTKTYLNTYIGMHTFGGPGTFVARVNCGYQMMGVVNSLLSINDPFRLYCTLNIFDPIALGYNSSPVFLSGLNNVDKADNTYFFSLNAFDPDGDELKYELATFGTEQGFDDLCTIPEATNYIDIDSITGDFLWDEPEAFGRYFFAVKIYEYRSGIFMGWTMRTYLIDHFDPDADPDIFIYADMSPGNLTINFGTNYYDRFGVNLFSPNGERIYSQFYQRPNETTESFDISNLPSGIYLLNLDIAPQPLNKMFVHISNKL